MGTGKTQYTVGKKTCRHTKLMMYSDFAIFSDNFELIIWEQFMALLKTNLPHVREFWNTDTEALNVELVLHEIEVDSVVTIGLLL